MYKPIRDYGIIGNLRSAALVGKDGSIDWAPAPFLDSPSVFAAILDEKKGGQWSIKPTDKFETKQEYIKDTNILVTTFTTKRGTCAVMDCLPIKNGTGMQDAAHTATLDEQKEVYEIHRKVVCKKGECEIEILFFPKFDYARGETKLELVDGGVNVVQGDKKGVLISRAQYDISKQGAKAHIKLKEGETHYLTFRYNTTEIPSKEDEHYEKDMRSTKEFWESWVHRCDLETCPVEYPWHESVVRSSLVLKILFLEPPGSIAAAATTSLPETIGGVRNWDYRFSWIRDSAFTVQALFWMGYLTEAHTYVKWLMSECLNIEKDGPETLQIMYGLRGQKDLQEKTLDHLEGYRKSKPVRIGNNAYKQKQWDIYGGLMNTVWQLHLRGSHSVDSELWEALRALANHVVKIWREPDDGIWEVRGEPRHFVHSKVMCWVALDRALKLAQVHGVNGEIDIWKQEKDALYNEIMKKGWSEKKQSFVQSFGSEDIDAAALLMPVLGFIEGKHPRMVSTIKRVEEELSKEEGLLLRYKSDDGLKGQEGIFLLTSFWLVDALVLAGEKERAEKLFEKLLLLANHVGLFSEEMDPKTKEMLGNFPQAYTHIGLINSAFYLHANGNPMTQFQNQNKTSVVYNKK